MEKRKINSKHETQVLPSLEVAIREFVKHNCIPILEGGGEIGGSNPQAVESEIRIHLHEDGTGYIHKMDEDSSTNNFRLTDETPYYELKAALQHLKEVVDEHGSATDTLLWRYRQSAIKFAGAIRKKYKWMR